MKVTFIGKEIEIPAMITDEFIETHPECVFVYNDNLIRRKLGGNPILKRRGNVVGFVGKKYAHNLINSFFTKEEYLPVFECEKKMLLNLIEKNQDRLFLISRIGGGICDVENIYDEIVHPWLEEVKNKYKNVILL